MPNEVNIRITATDLTGPAFASALAKMEALKNASKGIIATDTIKDNIGTVVQEVSKLKDELSDMSIIKMDISDLNSTLTSIKSRIQSLGIADIADINIPQGKIITQLQFLKRLIQQAGIADIMDININQSNLTKQLGFISDLTETIPVNFDIGKLPKIGVGGLSIPINFDMSKIPQFGEVSSISAWSDAVKAASTSVLSWDEAVKIADADAGQLAIGWQNTEAHAEGFGAAVKDVNADLNESHGFFSRALQDAIDYAATLNDGERYGAMFGSLFSNMLPNLSNLWGNVTNSAQGTYRVLQFLGTYVEDQLINAAAGAGNAWRAFKSIMVDVGHASQSFFNGMSDLGVNVITATATAITHLNDNISLGLPLWQSGGILWGGLGGHLQLFAGALTQIGLPAIIGTASGLHILIDGIIETVATLGPAIIAVAAFGASAVDTTTEIVKHFQDMNLVTDELGKNVYPLTGAFSAMNRAAQPQVYVLLGEGLQIVNKNAGSLAIIAHAAGSVIDQLGARITNAVTAGNGFNVFTRNAASDLAGWGNNIGNIFGILGNFLKVMPGYAEVILNVFGTVSSVIEHITGSGLGESIIGAGLAVHGFILYVGILGTAAAWLISSILPALAAGFLKLTLTLDALGLSEAGDAIAGIAPALEAMAALPWGWITIAGAAIGVLVYDLFTAKSAAQQFADGVQQSIEQVKLSALGSTITDDIKNYGTAFYYAKQQADLLAASTGHVVQVSNGKYSTSSVMEYGQAYYTAEQQVKDYAAAIAMAQQDQTLYNANMKQAAGVFGSAGNALAAFNNAGISSSQFLTTSKQQFAEDIIEAKGYNDAIQALTDGSGRYAAAMNALSGPEQYLGDMLKSIQSITQAQDNLMTVITEGETSLSTFSIGMYTLSTNFAATSNAATTAVNTLGGVKNSLSLVGNAMSGTSQADYTMQQSFYSQVNAGQQVIDALEQQEASTKSLTTATATIAQQMIPFAGNNDAARATIVALINDALGPGTVSLKTLNTWVNNNATSLGGLNSIIAASTIKAGQLANVLQTQLTAQFQADLLKSSGAAQAMQTFTDAITHGGDQTAAYRGARQQLIADLEKTGLSAQDANSYVNGLQKQIDNMHGKTVEVGVHMSGSGGIAETSTLPGMSQTTAHMILGGLSGGGLLPGFGGGDQLLRLLEPGEAVVDKYTTRKYASILAMMGVPGMSLGGPVSTSGGYGVTFADDWGNFFGQTALNDLKANLGKLKPANNSTYPSGGGSASTNQAIARAIMPSWTDPFDWQSWVALWNQESGWNQFAMNPSSGAYGIPQALPFTKMPQAAWPASAGGSSNVSAQEQWGIQYIAGRYGNPQNAWAHELEYNWYDNGGWLKPGMNLAYNGTGRPEHLTPDTGGVHITLELGQSFKKVGLTASQLSDLRYTVRTLGGGSVQKALGKNV